MNYPFLHEFTRSEGADPHLLVRFFIGTDQREPMFAYGYDVKVLDLTDRQHAHTARIVARDTYVVIDRKIAGTALPYWLARRLRFTSPYRTAA